jgi:hypothetical protein
LIQLSEEAERKLADQRMKEWSKDQEDSRVIRGRVESVLSSQSGGFAGGRDEETPAGDYSVKYGDRT